MKISTVILTLKVFCLCFQAVKSNEVNGTASLNGASNIAAPSLPSPPPPPPPPLPPLPTITYKVSTVDSSEATKASTDSPIEESTRNPSTEARSTRSEFIDKVPITRPTPPPLPPTFQPIITTTPPETTAPSSSLPTQDLTSVVSTATPVTTPELKDVPITRPTPPPLPPTFQPIITTTPPETTAPSSSLPTQDLTSVVSTATPVTTPELKDVPITRPTPPPLPPTFQPIITTTPPETTAPSSSLPTQDLTSVASTAAPVTTPELKDAFATQPAPSPSPPTFKPVKATTPPSTESADITTTSTPSLPTQELTRAASTNDPVTRPNLSETSDSFTSQPTPPPIPSTFIPIETTAPPMPPLLTIVPTENTSQGILSNRTLGILPPVPPPPPPPPLPTLTPIVTTVKPTAELTTKEITTAVEPRAFVFPTPDFKPDATLQVPTENDTRAADTSPFPETTTATEITINITTAPYIATTNSIELSDEMYVGVVHLLFSNNSVYDDIFNGLNRNSSPSVLRLESNFQDYITDLYQKEYSVGFVNVEVQYYKAFKNDTVAMHFVANAKAPDSKFLCNLEYLISEALKNTSQPADFDILPSTFHISGKRLFTGEVTINRLSESFINLTLTNSGDIFKEQINSVLQQTLRSSSFPEKLLSGAKGWYDVAEEILSDPKSLLARFTIISAPNDPSAVPYRVQKLIEVGIGKFYFDADLNSISIKVSGFESTRSDEERLCQLGIITATYTKILPEKLNGEISFLDVSTNNSFLLEVTRDPTSQAFQQLLNATASYLDGAFENVSTDINVQYFSLFGERGLTAHFMLSSNIDNGSLLEEIANNYTNNRPNASVNELSEGKIKMATERAFNGEAVIINISSASEVNRVGEEPTNETIKQIAYNLMTNYNDDVGADVIANLTVIDITTTEEGEQKLSFEFILTKNDPSDPFNITKNMRRTISQSPNVTYPLQLDPSRLGISGRAARNGFEIDEMKSGEVREVIAYAVLRNVPIKDVINLYPKVNQTTKERYVKRVVGSLSEAILDLDFWYPDVQYFEHKRNGLLLAHLLLKQPANDLRNISDLNEVNQMLDTSSEIASFVFGEGRLFEGSINVSLTEITKDPVANGDTTEIEIAVMKIVEAVFAVSEVKLVAVELLHSELVRVTFTVISQPNKPVLASQLQNEGRTHFALFDKGEPIPPGIYIKSETFEIKVPGPYFPQPYKSSSFIGSFLINDIDFENITMMWLNKSSSVSRTIFSPYYNTMKLLPLDVSLDYFEPVGSDAVRVHFFIETNKNITGDVAEELFHNASYESNITFQSLTFGGQREFAAHVRKVSNQTNKELLENIKNLIKKYADLSQFASDEAPDAEFWMEEIDLLNLPFITALPLSNETEGRVRRELNDLLQFKLVTPINVRETAKSLYLSLYSSLTKDEMLMNAVNIDSIRIYAATPQPLFQAVGTTETPPFLKSLQTSQLPTATNETFTLSQGDEGRDLPTAPARTLISVTLPGVVFVQIYSKLMAKMFKDDIIQNTISVIDRAINKSSGYEAEIFNINGTSYTKQTNSSGEKVGLKIMFNLEVEKVSSNTDIRQMEDDIENDVRNYLKNQPHFLKILYGRFDEENVFIGPFDMCYDESVVDCHVNARCIGTEKSFTCKCLAGYVDTKPTRPGRECAEKVQEASLTFFIILLVLAVLLFIIIVVLIYMLHTKNTRQGEYRPKDAEKARNKTLKKQISQQ